MTKAKKLILISTISLILILSILIGGFFMIFPMKPNVETASVDYSEEHNNDVVLVASYNTAAPWGNLLNGTHTTRRAHLFAKQINNIMPDIIGVQEINSAWVEQMKELLPQYEYYGVKRGGDETELKSEMNGIYYLTYRYKLLDSGTFWISDTPEVESKFKGAGCNRTVSYVVLENRVTGKIIAHLNTHLDNVSEDAQNLGARLLTEKANELKEKYYGANIIITGDFNQYENGVAPTTLETNGYINANVDNNEITYHDWGKGELTEPIDFIFTDKSNTGNYKVHSEKVDKSYVSDHYMITAEVYI